MLNLAALPAIIGQRFYFMAALIVLGLSVMTSAQAVTISPVIIEISDEKPIASVTVINPSDKTIHFQVETLSWHQADGVNHYQSTNDLLVSPPIAEIQPRGSQIFRVALRQSLSITEEQTYRLVLEDITEAVNPLSDVVTIRFRHNLPVYITPSGTTQAASSWSHCLAKEGQGCVRLDNAGNRRLRIIELTLFGPGWQQTLPGAAVLAGAWKTFYFDLDANLAPVDSIRAITEQGEISDTLSAP